MFNLTYGSLNYLITFYSIDASTKSNMENATNHLQSLLILVKFKRANLSSKNFLASSSCQEF